MSIGIHSLGEAALAAQADPAKNGKKGGPPPKRTIVARTDTMAQPEAR